MQVPERSSSKNALAGQLESTTQIGWQLFPQFMLRQAGFPFEWLQELCSPTTVQNATGLLTAYAKTRQIRRDAQESLQNVFAQNNNTMTSTLNQALIKFRTQLKKGMPVRADTVSLLTQSGMCEDVVTYALAWNTALEHLNALCQIYEQAYTQEYERISLLVVQRFCDDQRLQDVLLLSNEANFDIFARWLDVWKDSVGVRALKRDDRQKIYTLVMYLQRICAKNDTNSHFGPVSVGHVAVEHEGIHWKNEKRLKRVAYYTHWAASRVGQRMRLDETLVKWVRPRRKPYAFLTARNLRLLNFDYESSLNNEIHRGLRFFPTHTLTEDEAVLLQACDGNCTLLELFIWWQQERPGASWEAFWAQLEMLERYGAISMMFEVPVGSLDPLHDLQLFLPPEDLASSVWVNILDTAKTMLHEFAVANNLKTRKVLFKRLKEQFEQLTSSEPERGLGQTYADRSILFEECFRDLQDFSIGGVLARLVKDELALFYDLLLLVPRHRLEAERRMLNDWFVGRFGADLHVTLEAFLTAYIDDALFLEEQYKRIDVEINALEQIIDDALIPKSALDEAVIEVNLTMLQELINAYSHPIPAICNPDVMICAPSLEAIRMGEFQVLVGDCHALRDLLSHSSVYPFFQEVFPDFAENVVKLYRMLVDDDEEVVDVIRWHPTKVSSQLPLACLDLETQGLSPKSRNQVIALHELSVLQTSKGLRLYSSRAQKFVRLMTSGIGSIQMKRNPFSIFSFPRHHAGLPIRGNGRNHIPRIVMNQVIVQRQLWRIPKESFNEPIMMGYRQLDDDGEAGIFLRARRVQQDLKLPQYGFAKIVEEAKPIYVDFDSPLLIKQLTRLAKQTSHDIEFSEMIPGPGQLWLQNAQGSYTTELRLTVFSPFK